MFCFCTIKRCKISAKNLGVVLYSLLSFRSHIDSNVKTCNFHIRNLYMIKDFVNRKNLATLVQSLIVSKVDYCDSLFVPTSTYLRNNKHFISSYQVDFGCYRILNHRPRRWVGGARLLPPRAAYPNTVTHSLSAAQ